MSSIRIQKFIGTVSTAAALAASLAAALIAAPGSAAAQQGPQGNVVDLTTRARGPAAGDLGEETAAKAAYSFESRADSISWARYKSIAERAGGFRVVVSLKDKRLWAIVDGDTVLNTPVAVAKGTKLEYGNLKYRFETPRGVRTVLRKEADPVWQPPEWLYVETAVEYDLKLGHLYNGQKVKLSDGRFLTVQDGVAGVIDNGQFAPLPTDEHIVFDNTLFVPPLGSKNRKVEGELGKFRLDMGDGFLLHGTPYKDSIGLAATHGCVRLRDEDIEWLYEHVPVGTKVYIY